MEVTQRRSSNVATAALVRYSVVKESRLARAARKSSWEPLEG